MFSAWGKNEISQRLPRRNATKIQSIIEAQQKINLLMLQTFFELGRHGITN